VDFILADIELIGT